MSSGLLSFLSSLGKFWQEKTNQLFFRWNLLFIASQLLLLFWKFSDLPSAVPLYFSLPWGDSRLAPPLSLFLLPLFSILIVLTNHIFLSSFTPATSCSPAC